MPAVEITPNPPTQSRFSFIQFFHGSLRKVINQILFENIHMGLRVGEAVSFFETNSRFSMVILYVFNPPINWDGKND